MAQQEYGSEYKAHLLEQYKLYVEMMDKVTERRGQTNAFYISLLSALLALSSLLVNKDNAFFSGDKTIFLFALSVLGISFCYVWYININSYKQLNKLKFKVINDVEPLLPYPFYAKEWHFLETDPTNKYRRLSKVEKIIPLIMSIPYCSLLVYSIIRFFK